MPQNVEIAPDALKQQEVSCGSIPDALLTSAGFSFGTIGNNNLLSYSSLEPEMNACSLAGERL